MNPELADARDRAQATATAAIERMHRDAAEIARLRELLNVRSYAADRQAQRLRHAEAEVARLRAELADAHARLDELSSEVAA